MLDPNDSEINIDNPEDACKSDYFSDDGEVKNDTPNTESELSGKRKPIDIGLEEAKKIKVSVDDFLATDKITNFQTGIPCSDFKRAGSVTSDNSDEFVDASDVLEPIPTVEKKPKSTDDVDACSVKNADTSKSMFEAVSPKVKDKKFNSRLPTFADDPLDHFNSSAIRRGFFKEVEPPKSVDVFFDVGKIENKTPRKVKLNRSKFFSLDKPKFSDGSSSDSNTTVFPLSSPVKTNLSSSNENKIFQTVKMEDTITKLSVEEKIRGADEPAVTMPSINEPPKADNKSSSNTEPKNVPISAESENENHPINNDNIVVEPPSNSTIEEKIKEDVPQGQSDVQIEQGNLEISRIDETISEPIDSNLEQTETEELTLELDDLMEESIVEPVSKIGGVIDEKMNEFPLTDDESHPDEQFETEYESVIPEPECTSMESEYVSVMFEPESTSIEAEYESVMPEPESNSMEPEYESVVPERESTSIEPEVESIVKEPESTSIEREVKSIVNEPVSTSIEREVESIVDEPESTSIEREVESIVNEPESASIEREVKSVVREFESTSIEHEVESVVCESESTSIEREVESVVHEPEPTSIEPEVESIMHEPASISTESEPLNIESNSPEPLPIESEPLPLQNEPAVSNESSSPSQKTHCNESSSLRQSVESTVLQLTENEAEKQENEQVEDLEDYIVSHKVVSSQLILDKAEQIFVSESDPHQEPITDLDLVSETKESESTPCDEFIDTKDIQSESKTVQQPAVSETILEPENTETESQSQNTDFDITNESEDIADDKTETYVSNEESEGEIEEEEEEEIHEEELYLEDRVLVPPVIKPKEPSPPPQPTPSAVVEKETKDVANKIDKEEENVIQSSSQSTMDPELAKQSREPTPLLENAENISIEQPVQHPPSVKDVEDIPVEQKGRLPSEEIEHIPTEQTVRSTSSLEDIANIPVEQIVQRSTSLENIEDISVEAPSQPSPSLENIADISVHKTIQRTPSLEDIENIPMDIDVEPEPVDIEPIPKSLSKLEQALIGKSGIKKLEIQVPLEECPIPYEIVNERASSSNTDNEETKEKIKLHLSLQGDKVSIKKSPNTLVTSTSGTKTRRPYKKRNKEDNNLKPDKTYKLRTRSSKKDVAAQENGQTKPTVPSAVDKIIDSVIDSTHTEDTIYSAEPILIDSDDSTQSGSTKVQPLKLKISKNTNVTIQSSVSLSDADKNRDFSEDHRKKDSIPNLMGQAATAWSGPDLQRVERLLKESNITITPVLPKESIIPQSILKPMLSTAREKQSTTPKFSTPSVTSSVQSFQSSTSCITPISRNKYEDSSSDYSSPQSLERQNGEAVDHRRFRDGYETSPSSTDKQIDIKSEIRKMLASTDKRKPEQRDSTDMESDSSDSKPKTKSVPDLVPINLPTPEMLQSLATSLGANTTAEGDPLADKSKPEIDAAFLPLLQTFPKKRGRPTKAMVAAREALKQSQEVALENLKQLASQKASEGQPIPMPILDITDPEDLFKPKRGRKSRGERMDKSSDAEQSASGTTIDPEKEAEEIKRLEEERIKKEEEKERRNEIRRQKARERNDLVKAKRLRQKMKAEERQKRMQEKRRKLQEEKKKLEEEIKNLPTSMPGFDDETRMSTENSQALTMSFSTGMGDEDSSNATNDLSQRVKKSRMEVTDIDRDLTVDQIAEYQWPIQGGDLYMIQEQVSNYLGVKSFKRKYPDIKRRPVDSEEKAYLVDSGLVSETLCDLGLTAVSSAEVLDIMCADFPEKYEELRRYMREKQMKELSFKQKAWANGLGYKLLMADGTKQDLKKRAMESASNWNSALNKSRSDDRRCAIDLQTFIVHYPKTRTRKMTIPTPKMGSYPVSILPGQFCDFYKNYTSTELRYMPINTVMYGPLKPHAAAPGDGSQTDSDDSSSSDESSTTSEGTQATEDTIEDGDKDMSVDESSLLDKSHDLSLLKEQMTMELSENTRELIMDETAKILCKVCLGNITRNKENIPEVLIYCSQCNSTSHPSCLDLSLDMVPHIKKYAWQCPDCKICARCKENADEDKMLFCDICDRGYHIYCVGLKKVPSGRWQCQECTTVENSSCVNNSTPVREVFKEPGLIDLQDG